MEAGDGHIWATLCGVGVCSCSCGPDLGSGPAQLCRAAGVSMRLVWQEGESRVCENQVIG